MRRNRRDSIKSNTFPMVTLGKVVDTNDPKQMGRVRVLCSALGDSEDMLLRDLPWATYISPLAGVRERGSRGREDDTTLGPVAYGMWNVPKVGAVALVACLDGDPRLRVYFGQMHGELMTHTLPHGRFSMQGAVADLGDSFADAGIDSESGRPLGPFSSREEAIQPQFDNLVKSFTASTDTLNIQPLDTPLRNYEYLTRGADKSVSRLTEELVFDQSNASFARDDLFDPYLIDPSDTVRYYTQGYQKSRIEPGAASELTGDTYDSQIYSWTTPGFHSIAMDDAPNNCRMRFRTTHGHQIILDDSNERIYVSVAGGKAWIEIDEVGNIDFYAERNISFHAEKDFNITADNIRMKATSGIHMVSEGEIRTHSTGDDIHIKSDKNVRIHSGEETRVQAVGNLHIRTEELAYITSNKQMHVKTETNTLYLESNTDVHALAGGAMKASAATTVDIDAGTDVKITAGGGLDLKATADGKLSATGTLHLKGDGGLNMESGAAANILSAGGMNLADGTAMALNAPTIGLNSGGSAGPATAASAATPADAAIAAMATVHKNAFWTNRVPEHEPWPRVMTQETGPTATDNDGPDAGTPNSDLNTHVDAAELPYNDPKVGKVERGEELPRNKNWKR